MCSGCAGNVESDNTPERDIVVDCVCPPIPIRDFDYCACRDGDEEYPSRYGWGNTRQAAIESLLALEAEYD